MGSDRPRWTNLARGRFGHSFQSTVCLSPLFYHILIEDIRSDFCAEFRDILCPRSAAVGNFDPLAPPDCFRCRRPSITDVESLENTQELQPLAIQHAISKTVPGVVRHSGVFPLTVNVLVFLVCCPSSSVREDRLTLENIFRCSCLSFRVKRQTDSPKLHPPVFFLPYHRVPYV